jgi:hypothetical protein
MLVSFRRGLVFGNWESHSSFDATKSGRRSNHRWNQRREIKVLCKDLSLKLPFYKLTVAFTPVV